MAGVRDIGKIMQGRLDYRPSPAYYSKMRKCAGPCHLRKSITQFDGDSELCIKCTLRQPKGTK